MWREIVQFTIPWIDKQITIHTYGTVIVLAFLATAWWVRRRAHARLGLDKERVFNVCFALLFIGIGGARLLYALVHYERFTQPQPGGGGGPLSFLYIWEGGLVWYGGMIAGLLWLAWYLSRKPEMGGLAFLDVLAIGAGLGIFLGKWAMFLSGVDYGRPTGLPWGIPATWTQSLDRLRAEGMSAAEVRLHPSPVYEALFGLALFAVLLWLSRRGWRSGRLTAVFLMAFAVGKVLLEFLRWDDAERGMLGGRWVTLEGGSRVLLDGVVSTSQLISIPVFFAGLALWLVRRPEDARLHHPRSTPAAR